MCKERAWREGRRASKVRKIAEKRRERTLRFPLVGLGVIPLGLDH